MHMIRRGKPAQRVRNDTFPPLSSDLILEKKAKVDLNHSFIVKSPTRGELMQLSSSPRWALVLCLQAKRHAAMRRCWNPPFSERERGVRRGLEQGGALNGRSGSDGGDVGWGPKDSFRVATGHMWSAPVLEGDTYKHLDSTLPCASLSPTTHLSQR